MVKAYELRIGNIVSANGNLNIVTGIMGRDVYYKDKLLIGNDVLEGVTLTPEVLGECGFKDKLDGNGYQNTNFMYIGRFSDGYAFMQDDKSKIGIGFRYLHQLQNLYFAFTGEELTISL